VVAILFDKLIQNPVGLDDTLEADLHINPDVTNDNDGDGFIHNSTLNVDSASIDAILEPYAVIVQHQ
jgi:hypothetical protein